MKKIQIMEINGINVDINFYSKFGKKKQKKKRSTGAHIRQGECPQIARGYALESWARYGNSWKRAHNRWTECMHGIGVKASPTRASTRSHINRNYPIFFVVLDVVVGIGLVFGLRFIGGRVVFISLSVAVVVIVECSSSLSCLTGACWHRLLSDSSFPLPIDLETLVGLPIFRVDDVLRPEVEDEPPPTSYVARSIASAVLLLAFETLGIREVVDVVASASLDTPPLLFKTSATNCM